MPRWDLSTELIHFTKGETSEAAYARLCTILNDGFLRGSDHLIMGNYRCVCFTEAPRAAMAAGLVNNWNYGRYAPFGLIFDKRWLFEQGARPVIYQPAAEFYDLPASHAWRHMTYEPDRDPPVDFTWEREWRLQTEQLRFDPSCAGIVVSDRDWEAHLLAEHGVEQDWRVLEYSQIMDASLAEQLRDPYPWTLTSLRR